MTTETKNAFVRRFGKLVDVMDRESAKGAYITFKMEGTNKAGETFDIYGSCFNAENIEKIKAAVGEVVWMKGPVDAYGEGENRKTSFKCIYFGIQEAKADDAASEEAADVNNDEVPA